MKIVKIASYLRNRINEYFDISEEETFNFEIATQIVERTAEKQRLESIIQDIPSDVGKRLVLNRITMMDQDILRLENLLTLED